MVTARAVSSPHVWWPLSWWAALTHGGAPVRPVCCPGRSSVSQLGRLKQQTFVGSRSGRGRAGLRRSASVFSRSRRPFFSSDLPSTSLPVSLCFGRAHSVYLWPRSLLRGCWWLWSGVARPSHPPLSLALRPHSQRFFWSFSRVTLSLVSIHLDPSPGWVEGPGFQFICSFRLDSLSLLFSWNGTLLCVLLSQGQES